MQAADEKIIPLNKEKLALIVFIGCIFIGLGAWLVSQDEAEILSRRRFNNSTIVHILGFLTIAFFGFGTGYGIKKLFDKRPGLIFNSAGIIDNSSAVSAGLIPWAEVTGANVFEIHNQKMLIIMVRNPQKYVDRGGFFKQMLNKGNYKMCGSPIFISSNALEIDFNELLSIFKQFHQKYGSF